MPHQRLHAVVEAVEVFRQLGQGILDHVNLLARFNIFEHRARRIEHRHQGRRRHDPHASLLRVAHHLRVIGVDLGKHRLGRHKHHRAVRGLTSNDVFTGDGVHMALHVDAEGALRSASIRLRHTDLEHPVIVFKRKLGVHRHPARRLGQRQQAVHPHVA